MKQENLQFALNYIKDNAEHITEVTMQTHPVNVTPEGAEWRELASSGLTSMTIEFYNPEHNNVIARVKELTNKGEE